MYLSMHQPALHMTTSHTQTRRLIVCNQQHTACIVILQSIHSEHLLHLHSRYIIPPLHLSITTITAIDLSVDLISWQLLRGGDIARDGWHVFLLLHAIVVIRCQQCVQRGLALSTELMHLQWHRQTHKGRQAGSVCIQISLQLIDAMVDSSFVIIVDLLTSQHIMWGGHFKPIHSSPHCIDQPTKQPTKQATNTLTCSTLSLLRALSSLR